MNRDKVPELPNTAKKRLQISKKNAIFVNINKKNEINL